MTRYNWCMPMPHQGLEQDRTNVCPHPTRGSDYSSFVRSFHAINGYLAISHSGKWESLDDPLVYLNGRCQYRKSSAMKSSSPPIMMIWRSNGGSKQHVRMLSFSSLDTRPSCEGCEQVYSAKTSNCWWWSPSGMHLSLHE